MGIAPVMGGVEFREGALVNACPPYAGWDSGLWLVTHRDIHRTPKMQAMTGLIKRHLSNGERKKSST